jgi:GDPmannose 4,6-dehydratase
MGNKTALITGITGQDGAYLAAHLLGLGYRVYGMRRRGSFDNVHGLVRLGIAEHRNLTLVSGDITDLGSLMRVVEDTQPDEVYNLAAQSFVGASWQQPLYTSMATGLGALNVFEAVRTKHPGARVYQASSSEMFGNAPTPTQNESTPFSPRSPYGVAKVFAHHMAANYRDSFDMDISCGILFNHESPLRGLEFVTRKITHAVAKIACKQMDQLTLGNLDACRDWGHARDYVQAMHAMLQRCQPEDYVIATGHTTSVKTFCAVAFDCAGLNFSNYVRSIPDLKRPAELHSLCGDPLKAKRVLGWSATTTLRQLIEEMVAADLELVRKQ